LGVATSSEARLSSGGHSERIELLALETPSGQYNAGIVLLTCAADLQSELSNILTQAGISEAERISLDLTTN